jgi:hypothetical protein
MSNVIPPGSRFATELAALADGDGVVVVAAGPDIGDDWEAIAHELGEAFEATQAAVRAGHPVVYVVAGEDLLGQRGSPASMVACGLLSAARTAAIEGARASIAVNVVAAFADAEPVDVAAWVGRLWASHGVSGELVRLGTGHLGKALP